MQDEHRQETIDWCHATGDKALAFDFTTKAILQEAIMRKEYGRLKDANGKAAGVLGWEPQLAVTFLDNHDTGSTQNHWPFPAHAVHQVGVEPGAQRRVIWGRMWGGCADASCAIRCNKWAGVLSLLRKLEDRLQL